MTIEHKTLVVKPGNAFTFCEYIYPNEQQTSCRRASMWCVNGKELCTIHARSTSFPRQSS